MAPLGLLILILAGCGGPAPVAVDRRTPELVGDYEVVQVIISEFNGLASYRPPSTAGFLSFYPDGSYSIDLSLTALGARFVDRGTYQVSEGRYTYESQMGMRQERALPSDLRTLAFSGFVDQAGRRFSFTGYFRYGRPRF
jgi:hypothetical protein